MGLLSTLFGSGAPASSVYGPQEQYLKDIYGQAQGMFQGAQTPDYYQPMQEMAGRGLMSTIGGEYLPGREAFNTEFQAALAPQISKIMPSVASTFARGGRFGSGLFGGEVAKQIGEAGAGIYGTMRENERQRQQQAMLGLPQFQAGLMQVPWANLQAYKDIIGQPTVLGGGGGSPGLLGGLGNLVNFSFKGN